MIRFIFAGLALLTATPCISASSFDGTWKADLAATKIDQRPEFLLLKDGVYECSACTPPLRIPADGKVHATPNRDRVDAMSATIIDDRTMRVASYKAGTKIAEFDRTLAADGNTMTTVWRSQDPATQVWKTRTSRMKRVGPAPPGSFAQSGYWLPIAEEDGSAIVLAIKLAKGRLTVRYTDESSYTAAFDNVPVAVTGDPGATVALRWLNERSFEETNFLRGQPTAVNTYRLTDPRTLQIKSKNVRNGFTDTYLLRRQ